MKKLKLIILSFLLFMFMPVVYAADVTFASGSANMYIGGSVNINVVMNSNVGKILAFEGEFGVSDSSCIRINSVSSNFGTNGNRIATVDTSGNGYASGTVIATINVSGLKACQGRITMSAIETGTSSGSVSSATSFGTISVTEPPSSNNNLSSLGVSVGSLSPAFSKGNTTYSVSVDSDVTNITITGSAEDGGARVDGTGSKSLGYGNNSFGIKVTAPSGATKTYTVNVNRRDNRSTNNNLSSLSIEGGTISPGFDAGTTNYSVTIPFSYSTANIKANAADSKAKVSVTGNTGLVAEETTNVSVTVTAENGSQKTYVIAVTRGKDPNKILSTDNNLVELKPSIGILSPVFDKEKTNYVIYLPYEVDKISFSYKLSDTRYGSVDEDIPTKLVSGISNVFKFNVKAEDESIKTYTVTVKRAENPELETSSNTYLQSINLTNGELLFTDGKVVTDFNKEIKKYYYKKNNDFTYEVVPEDPNAVVTTVEDGSSIQFIVEAPNGEFSVYTLDLYGNYNNIFMYILVFILGGVCGISGTILTQQSKKRKKEKKAKKLDKEVKEEKKSEK